MRGIRGHKEEYFSTDIKAATEPGVGIVQKSPNKYMLFNSSVQYCIAQKTHAVNRRGSFCIWGISGGDCATSKLVGFQHKRESTTNFAGVFNC
jgi:hypothetical protein